MKQREVVKKVKRILDAALEKFNATCEQHGIDPDSEEFSETSELTDTEGTEGVEGENASIENGEGGSEGNENVMPTPVDAEGQQIADGGGAGMVGGIPQGVPSEIPLEAQQMPVGDVNAGVEAPVGEQPNVPSPEEQEMLLRQQEELLRQQQQQQQQQ